MERLQFAATAAIVGNKLVGTAHTYGHLAKLGTRYEQMAPGSFDRILKAPTTDARSFYNHDKNLLLGRMSAGTLEVSSEDDGLHYSVELPDTSYARDLKVLIDRGDVTGCSFGMIPMPSAMTFSKAPDGLEIRTHHDMAELYDVSPVTTPAFEGTSLQLHSADFGETMRSVLVRARFRAGRR